MNYLAITYGIYLLLSVILTVWVGRTLFKHGRIFLIEIFHSNRELADAVNKLLVVGFYLVNIGYAVFTLQTYHSVNTMTDVIERLGLKVGGIILILGAMHFFILLILFATCSITGFIDWVQPGKKVKGYRLPLPSAE